MTRPITRPCHGDRFGDRFGIGEPFWPPLLPLLYSFLPSLLCVSLSAASWSGRHNTDPQLQTRRATANQADKEDDYGPGRPSGRPRTRQTKSVTADPASMEHACGLYISDYMDNILYHYTVHYLNLLKFYHYILPCVIVIPYYIMYYLHYHIYHYCHYL